MSKANEAAKAVKNLSNIWKQLGKVGEALEVVGNLDNAAVEAKTRAAKAQKEAAKEVAKAEELKYANDRVAAEVENAKRDYDEYYKGLRATLKKHVDTANKKAKEVVDKAEKEAKDIKAAARSYAIVAQRTAEEAHQQKAHYENQAAALRDEIAKLRSKFA